MAGLGAGRFWKSATRGMHRILFGPSRGANNDLRRYYCHYRIGFRNDDVSRPVGKFAVPYDYRQITPEQRAELVRRTTFEARLLEEMNAVGAESAGWVVLPNHYHIQNDPKP